MKRHRQDTFRIWLWPWTTATVTMIVPITVTPPMMDGGEPNDLTNHNNTAYRTSGPRALIDTGQVSMNCNYDPEMYDELPTAIHTVDTITITMPNNDTLAVIGSLRSITPGELVEGQDPEAQVIIDVHNRTAAGVETGPAWTAAV